MLLSQVLQVQNTPTLTLSNNDKCVSGDDNKPLLSFELQGPSFRGVLRRILGSEVYRVHTQVSPSTLTDPV